MDRDVEDAFAGEFPKNAGVAANMKFGQPAMIELDRLTENARLMRLDPRTDRFGAAGEERSDNRGGKRDSNRQGVKDFRENVGGLANLNDDEGKFTDRNEGQAGCEAVAAGMADRDEAEGARERTRDEREESDNR